MIKELWLLMVAGLLAAVTGWAQGPTSSPLPAIDFVGLDQAAEAKEGSLEYEGLTRTFLTYVPNNLPTGAVPLVFVLHGGGGNALATMQFNFEGQWNNLADRDKFIVIYPEGRPDPEDQNDHHWNDCRNDVTDSAALSTNDDVGLIEALIEWIDDDYNIDSNRLYVTGLSNGGMMTYRLATELSDQIAAAAGIIANQPENSECPAPSNAVPMLIMNGSDDDVMPFIGGFVGQSANRGSVLSSAATTNWWVTINQVHPFPAVTNLPDIVTSDDSTVTVYTYTNGIGGSEVVYYLINDGGHQVPGENPADPFGSGVKNSDIIAAVEIWDFFQRHSRP